VAIIKCSNCNHTMIRKKDYFECPICHQIKDVGESVDVKKENYKDDLIKIIKENVTNEVLLNNSINKVLSEKSTDKLALLIISYIERNIRPDSFQQNIFDFFSSEEEEPNYEIILKYLIDNSEYKFLINIEDCIINNPKLSGYIDSIYEKKKLIEEEIEKTSLINADVFVCYSSNDSSEAIKIVDTIENAGITCWYAGRNMPKNHPTNYDYKKNIDAAISKCKIFLVIASKNSMYSSDVQWEIDKAIEYNCGNRVEYLISSLKHTPRFRDFFDGLQWIDATENDETDILIERLNYLLSRKNVEEAYEEIVDSHEAPNNDDATKGEDDLVEGSYQDESEKVDDYIYNNQDDVNYQEETENDDNDANIEQEQNIVNQKELGINAYFDNDYEEAITRFSNCEIDSEINYYLANIYNDSTRSTFDLDKAYDAVMNSQDSRIADVSNEIGKKYYIGSFNTINADRAFECFIKAANMGNDKALYNVAICYNRGKGVSKDIDKAFEYYKKSADAGNVKAMCEYGEECLNESSNMYNTTIGMNYLSKAANLGSPEAQFGLGICYYNGIGVPVDYSLSIEWLDKAIQNGSKAAKEYKSTHFNDDMDYDNENCALELDDLDDLDIFKNN